MLSIIYIAVIMVPGRAAEGERPESEYILMLLQCTAGVLIMFLPALSKNSASRYQARCTSYLLFSCSVRYTLVKCGILIQFKHWDVLLHAIGGGMLGALGFSFVALLNKEERVPVNLSPLFVSLFAFCFAVMLGVLWEVYEFAFDGLLGLNMQKFALEDGTLMVGREALMNTMKDLIVDAVGALAISVIGYISLKYRKGWLDSLLIKRRKTKAVTQTEKESLQL